MNQRREILIQCLSDNVGKVVSKMTDDGINSLEEIRIRTGIGVAFKGSNAVCKAVPNEDDIKQIIMRMSDYSIYAHMQQLRQGFITLKGGHRVGIVGRCVVDKDRIENITEISGICIRLASQIKGVADSIAEISNDNNLLIISPPGCGKTTLLRDLARQLGRRHNISLIDERCELAACVDGIPQLDVGRGTDVISNVSKRLAIPLLVRSMSPDIIMTDELSEDDIASVTEACSMGVKVIATVHGCNLKDVQRRMDTDVFDKFIILDRNKRITEVA